ncbi:MAG TPA: VIT1/CCC1 transporter family protein [Terriglobales bacterium]|nr:VIT1/CCC1 transporter family protein [Terriglobales bacterium]
MPEDSTKPSRRILNPMERVSEILFGLIMVLTITCSFSIGEAGQGDVRNMLIGALGCNLAWGFIDAVMYWMACFSTHGQGILALRAVRAAAGPDEADHIIARAMPPLLASVVSPAQFESMRKMLAQLPEPPERPRLTKEDWLGGVGVFLLVVFATLPVVLPFALVSDARRALRISNGIAIVMLFLTGYIFGRYAGHRPWRMGLLMVVLGSAMVGITIALGG